MMEIISVKDLEKQVKKQSKIVESTERLIRDLKDQASIVRDGETLERIEMRIARLNYRLLQERETLAQSEARLRQVKQDFQENSENETRYDFHHMAYSL